jgi:hypothetical protein
MVAAYHWRAGVWVTLRLSESVRGSRSRRLPWANGRVRRPANSVAQSRSRRLPLASERVRRLQKSVDESRGRACHGVSGRAQRQGCSGQLGG